MATLTRPEAIPAHPATITIRPVRSSDAAGLAAFYTDLSAESRRLRFLGACAGIGGERSRAFCTPDHEHAEGFVAVQPGTARPGETVCGHICLEPAEGDGMELAVAVADALGGRGIGSALLRAALAWAAGRGVTRITATTFPENRALLRLLEHVPGRLSVAPLGGGVLEVAILLAGSGPEGR